MRYLLLLLVLISNPLWAHNTGHAFSSTAALHSLYHLLLLLVPGLAMYAVARWWLSRNANS